MEKLKKVSLKKCVLLIIILVCTINIIAKSDNNIFSTLIAFILILLNIYQLISYRKNKKLFILFLMVFYFNYSIVFGKYLFSGTSLLNNLYYQLHNYKLTMSIGINLLLLFNSIIAFVLSYSDISDEKQIYLGFEKSNTKKVMSLILFLIPLLVIIYMLINKVEKNTTYFEYLNIVFIFAFLIFKNNKMLTKFMEILMVILCIYSFYTGQRIGALQFLLSDFIINYLPKFKIKHIILFGTIGIVILTILGVYGDLRDAHNVNEFSLKRVYNEVSDRRFASDTAISAYFPSSACIETTNNNYIPIKNRLKNGLEYFTLYTLLGQGQYDYKLPTYLVLKYYFHTGGGVITGYFYFWFGIIGVILISIYLGFIIKNGISFKNPNFLNLYFIYMISTFPRWYLYYPTSLFRGTIIFIAIYLILKYIFKMKINVENQVKG